MFSIYKITNIVNGKCYIGYSQTPNERWKTHIRCANSGDKKKLYSAMRKYGISNFNFDIIYQSDDREHTLLEMEPFYIKQYNSVVEGYNMNEGGYNVNTDEMRSQNSKRMKQNNPMKTIRTNNGSFKKGRKYEMSSAHKQAITKSKLGKNNPNYGNKMAAAHLNEKLCCEHCGKISNKGNHIRWHSKNCKDAPVIVDIGSL